MDFTLTFLGDGFLIGFTYFAKDDRIEAFEDEDWTAFSCFYRL